MVMLKTTKTADAYDPGDSSVAAPNLDQLREALARQEGHHPFASRCRAAYCQRQHRYWPTLGDLEEEDVD